ncbi:hypothetical protein RG963_06485 [Methanosarcina sp. Z-7115]|uniref:Mobile element protein n=1 Tax=Methanosarcina baikalica TaxID=3073890 RepID=A0ABU2D0B6_9EURY|nr:hypothetical protein [Methanosarcina sp. Z-7115]MDR7665436.1 hypothetical protein [Methanosarcina sp. Z-7115]
MKEKYPVSGFTKNKEAIYVTQNRKTPVRIEYLRKQVDLMSDQLNTKDDQINEVTERKSWWRFWLIMEF